MSSSQLTNIFRGVAQPPTTQSIIFQFIFQGSLCSNEEIAPTSRCSASNIRKTPGISGESPLTDQPKRPLIIECCIQIRPSTVLYLPKSQQGNTMVKYTVAVRERWSGDGGTIFGCHRRFGLSQLGGGSKKFKILPEHICPALLQHECLTFVYLCCRRRAFQTCPLRLLLVTAIARPSSLVCDARPGSQMGNDLAGAACED